MRTVWILNSPRIAFCRSWLNGQEFLAGRRNWRWFRVSPAEAARKKLTLTGAGGGGTTGNFDIISNSSVDKFYICEKHLHLGKDLRWLPWEILQYPYLGNRFSVLFLFCFLLFKNAWVFYRETSLFVFWFLLLLDCLETGSLHVALGILELTK